MLSVRRAIMVAAVTAMALATGSPQAMAQTGPASGVQTPGGTNGPRTTFTFESVPQLLKQLGYQPANKTMANGTQGWEIAAQQDGWKFVVQVAPFVSNGKIMALDLLSDLVKASSPEHAAILTKALNWNHSTGVVDHFGMNPSTGFLTMKRSYNFPDASVEELRSQFSNFFRTIRDTYAIWGNTPALAPTTNPAGNSLDKPAVNTRPGGRGRVSQKSTTDAPSATHKSTTQSIAGVYAAAAQSVAGAVLKGSESLAGFGILTFELHADGKAVMIDARGKTHGAWTQSGADVNIQFKNCVYQGRLEGTQLSGTAQYTGQANVQNWTFRVTMMPKA